jgi:preprotein translocase subunit SecG
MILFVTIIHVIMCLILIAIVLLQSGKGANMGAAFGGGSNTLFGSTGPASFLNKVTTIAAVVFMITSFTLAIISSKGGETSKVLENAPVQQEQPVERSTSESEEVSTEDEAAPSNEETPAAAPSEDTQGDEQSSPSEE